MKIVYVSGVKFGHSLLEEILEHNFEISAVISYSDSKKSVYSDFASFDSICNKFNIQNIKVNNINDAENIKILKSLKPDLILIMCCYLLQIHYLISLICNHQFFY